MRRRLPAKCRKPAERNVDFFIDEYTPTPDEARVAGLSTLRERLLARVPEPLGPAEIRATLTRTRIA